MAKRWKQFTSARITTTPMRPVACPHCGDELDMVTGVGFGADTDVHEPVLPVPGSITICGTCNDYSVFDAQLQLRKPTEADFADLPEEVREVYRRWLHYRKARLN